MKPKKSQVNVINERPEGMDFDTYKRLRNEQANKKRHKMAFRVWDNRLHGTYTRAKAQALQAKGILFT